MDRTISLVNEKTALFLSSSVLLIHGRERSVLATVENFLGTLNIHARSLHAQGEERSVIAQAQELAAPSFVIALVGMEDVNDYLRESRTGRIQNEHSIVCDLAYFAHVVGARNVCVLHKGQVDSSLTPRKVSRVSLDDPVWRNLLVDAMKLAGLNIDVRHSEANLQSC